MAKREFYAKYASKKHKGDITSAFLFVCSYAIITLFSALISQNRADFAQSAFAFLFALAVQTTKSRPCAILFFLYACADVASTFVFDLERRGCWWILSFIALLAVRGAFSLQREYQAFLGLVSSNGLGPGFGSRLSSKSLSVRPPAAFSEPKAASVDKRISSQRFASIFQFIGIFLGIFLMYFYIGPQFYHMLDIYTLSQEPFLRKRTLRLLAIIGATIASIIFATFGILLPIINGIDARVTGGESRARK